MNLRNRIERLETTSAPREDLMIIVRVIVTGFTKDAECVQPWQRIRTNDGQTFERASDETEDEFMHRAAKAAGWPNHAVRLIVDGKL